MDWAYPDVASVALVPSANTVCACITITTIKYDYHYYCVLLSLLLLLLLVVLLITIAYLLLLHTTIHEPLRAKGRRFRTELIWGAYYNFTNYNVRTTLEFAFTNNNNKRHTPFAKGVNIKCLLKFIVFVSRNYNW